MRKQAAHEAVGLNVWFGNVEFVTAREVGQEPVRYVANLDEDDVADRLGMGPGTIRHQVREA